MTFQINRSVINALAYDYQAAVEKFLQEKLAHRFTLDPAPRAPDIVEQAVRRIQYPIEDQKPDDFVIDYEVIEDVVPPTLAERKAALVMQLRHAEAEAMAKVISPARERLLRLDVNAIQKPPEERTAEEQALFERYAEVNARKLVVHRYFVEREIELEEIGEADVDGWSFAPFVD